MTRHLPGRSAPPAVLILLWLATAASAALAGAEPPAAAARPGYLERTSEPAFGTVVTRITGETGSPTAPVPGVWGRIARHTYSKQQPWSADGSLLVVENREGGSPAKLFLDGTTYKPVLAPCVEAHLYDFRWHPSRSHPHEVVNVDKSGRELSWFDVTTCSTTRRWALPITADYGIGSGEGNLSNDGRFVCIGNSRQMVVVDMDPQPPDPPYPHVRIGPVYTFAPCSLSVGDPDDGCKVDNLSISPSGRYVVVKYGTRVDTTQDAERVYDVDPATLALRPHAMADAALRCGSFAARPNGWIFPLKHADLALDPDDGNQDVAIGGRSCPGSSIGRLVLVRLRDGRVTPLTDPRNEAAVFHVSTRNLERPGWVYASYYRMPGRRFSDEVVAVRMDGSGVVEHWARLHSVTSGCYRCEPQPVPSPDGRRVLFASNWAQDCDGGCGPASEVKDYVAS